MSSKKNKLNAMVDIFQAENLEGAILSLDLAKIKPAESQPRKEVQKSIDELAKSIQADGLLQPIVVTKNGSQYTIIAGERRFHACKKIGLKEIECKVLNKTPEEAYRLAVIENLQRENLSAFEEVEALFEMKKLYNYTDQKLAETFNKSRNYMTELLSIAQLPQEILQIAKDSGINSKNILIQLYQAYKNNQHEEFLKQFLSGEITTVKQAKQYNKTEQASPKSQTKKQNKYTFELVVSTKKNKIQFEFPEDLEPNQKLEIELKKAMQAAANKVWQKYHLKG